jgi:hypothetical protein
VGDPAIGQGLPKFGDPRICHLGSVSLVHNEAAEADLLRDQAARVRWMVLSLREAGEQHLGCRVPCTAEYGRLTDPASSVFDGVKAISWE